MLAKFLVLFFIFITMLSLPLYGSRFCRHISLSSYLKQNDQKLIQKILLGKNKQFKKLTFVIGNQSMDLDSFSASISYARLKSAKSKDPKHIYIPLMNVSRTDFRLKTESIYLANALSIKIANLVFLNEINFKQLEKKINFDFILIDENYIERSELQKYSHKVIEVLDHHKDHQLYTVAPSNQNLIQIQKKKIETVGSVSTLIAEEIISSNFLSPKIAQLLLAPILIDTANLTAPGRTTQKDKRIAKTLKRYLKKKNILADPDSFYKDISEAKTDTTALTITENLLKDQKIIELEKLNVAIASIATNNENTLKWLQRKNEDLEIELNNYLKNTNSIKKIDLVIVIFALTGYDSFSREIILYAGTNPKSKAIKSKLIDFMKAQKIQDTDLITDLDFLVPESFDAFTLHRSMSRKKLVPEVLDKFLQ